MATKIHKSNDEVEEERLHEENDRRTNEARTKIVEIRAKSQERSDDDKRERALQSIHRMEWLKTKDDLSIFQRKNERKPPVDLLPLKKKELDDYFSGTAKAKQRGRKKERVELVKTLEGLGVPIPEPPPSRFPTHHPSPVNAWSVKPGSALFPNSTAATIVTLKLKNYDEDAMLEKALKESLSSAEDHFPEDPRYERRIPEQERFRNGNQSAHRQRNDFEHSDHKQSNNIEHLAHGHWNEFEHTQRNGIITKPEMSDQNRSPRMKQSFGQLHGEVEESDSNTTEKKPGNSSSDGKSGSEKVPIDYYQSGKELAERRARERAIMFASMEAEKKKNKMAAQETKPAISSEIVRGKSQERQVRFSPNISKTKSDEEGKEDLEYTSREMIPDMRADVRLRLSPDPERLTRKSKSFKDEVEHKSPKIPAASQEEQRQMWTLNYTTVKSSKEVPPPCDVPQQNSTDSIQPQEQETPTNQNAAPQRMFTPEDFIIMEGATGPEDVSLEELSLGYEAGLNQYNPYKAEPYDIGNYTMPNGGFLPQYNASYPDVLAQNVSSSLPSYVPTDAAAPKNDAVQNFFKIGLQTGCIPQYNLTNPAVEVSSTVSGSTNLTPNYVTSDASTALNNIASMNCYAANALLQNIPTTVSDTQSQSDSSTYEVKTNLQPQVPIVPVTAVPSGVLPNTSLPSFVQGGGRGLALQNLLNIDPRVFQWNYILNQYIMAHLSGNPEAGGSNAIENLPFLVPSLPNVPSSSPTPPTDVPKPSPPPPVLDPNLSLPNSLHQTTRSLPQSALLTTTNFQAASYTDLSQPLRPPAPAQAGYYYMQPKPRVPGSFIRGPASRGRGTVQTLN